jgi:hypothetical protein
MFATGLQSAEALLAVLTPLVAVPLTLITFYLRSLRDHQVTGHAQLERRVETLDLAAAELRRALAELDRNYAGKEEWLRESLHARREIERLAAAFVRIETRLEGLPRRYARRWDRERIAAHRSPTLESRGGQEREVAPDR